MAPNAQTITCIAFRIVFSIVLASSLKFSDLIKKHSDLLIAVGTWAVKLLIGQQR